ncbi:hypothetical protein [Microcella alkaliphila]|uniref:Tail terminator n=1 Tax=Microcella alkaliphila TaxID=279828 RepID=A0A0U5B9E8_9MICO|nr:hypothetical protein [Microcella alkaliphila]BAU32457.1 uncharacterized protein MalAC0309_1606 [Microcella alkaliphila]
MAELLVPADVEVDVAAELDSRFASNPHLDVTWATRIPGRDDQPRPERWGRVLAAGGSGRDLVTDRFTVTIEGWSTTESEAERICAYGVAYLQQAAREKQIGATACYGLAVFGLPANLPFPGIPDRYRFTATVSIDLRRSTS